MIHDYCGIYFEDNKRYLLESRVHQRMQSARVRSYDDYLRLLGRGGADGELSVLVNAVTINETYFFRHPAQLELMEQHLIPDLIRKKEAAGIPRVRIWSAACSSGDEAYSLALLVRDRLHPRFPRAMIEIVATDIDTTILQSARRATYSEYAVRNVPEDLLEKYFTRQEGRYVLDRTVRDMVRFRRLNLIDAEAMQSVTGFDIILCANVLIYFDASARRRVLDLLHRSLMPHGYLFVGFSETLYGISHRFTPVRHDRTVVYMRDDGEGREHSLNPALRPLSVPNQSS